MEEEPVFYCKHCHSLQILVDDRMADDDWDGSYCGKCYSTDIGQCSIEEWLAVEEEWKRSRNEIEWKK